MSLVRKCRSRREVKVDLRQLRKERCPQGLEVGGRLELSTSFSFSHLTILFIMCVHFLKQEEGLIMKGKHDFSSLLL